MKSVLTDLALYGGGFLAFIGALGLILVISGCATVNGVPTTNLTPAAQAALQAALDSYCPVLGAVQTSMAANPSLATTDVRAAEKTLALACPPNPAPTNGAVVAVDILQAYVVLAPLLPKKVAAHANAHYAAMKARYHLH